jgi:phosphoribosyl 1,2-cyclic phosphate phosphodiesterase
MRFYGTSAAEGIPNPFCACAVCENARKVGGAEIRRRSFFRINEQTSIDLGADAFQQAIDYGDFTKLQHVIVTHTHEDHLNYMMMNVRNMAIERTAQPLNYYFTDRAYDIADFYRRSRPVMKGLTRDLEERGVIAFNRLEFHKTVEIAGLKVTPLRGNHKGNMGEDCANYLIELADGRRMYYGVDTGWYLPETTPECGFPKQIVRLHGSAVSDGCLIERLDIVMLLKDDFTGSDQWVEFFHEVLVPAHDVADDVPDRPFALFDGSAEHILRARHQG